MADYHDLLDAIARIRADTGDPGAWMQGLSADELAMVASPITINSPGLIDAVLAKIQAPRSGGDHPADLPDSGGEAARAISIAETSLARQNSVTAQLDLQVVSAILNAHATNAAGSGALDDLQSGVESAVIGSVNLDTPAGARELQRYLTGLIREIKIVVESSSLDATSKAALAAALASLYRGTTPAEEQRCKLDDPQSRLSTTESAGLESPARPGVDSAGADPLLDELLAGDYPETSPDMPAMPAGFATPTLPQIPAIPGLAGLSSAPASGMPLGGVGLPGGGLPISDLLARLATEGLSRAEPGESPDLPDTPNESQDAAADHDRAKDGVTGDGVAGEGDASDGEDEHADQASAERTVELPTGEVITAKSPELAKAISSAVAGTPIAEAFQSQGITIPAPGTIVTDPLDPERLAPGDIGVFTDRHALALGNGKAVLNSQIQPIASIADPSFLGWEHPPHPGTVTQSDDPDSPAPTRPAVTVPPSE